MVVFHRFLDVYLKDPGQIDVSFLQTASRFVALIDPPQSHVAVRGREIRTSREDSSLSMSPPAAIRDSSAPIHGKHVAGRKMFIWSGM